MRFDWGNGVSVIKRKKVLLLGDYEGVLLRIRIICVIIGVGSWKFLEIFGLGPTWIFAEFLFEGFVFFDFSKLLFFDEYSFVVVILLADFHLVINLLHKHNFCLSFLAGLFKLLILSLSSGLSLNVNPSPSLPTHPNITLYPQSSNDIPTANTTHQSHQLSKNKNTSPTNTQTTTPFATSPLD